MRIKAVGNHLLIKTDYDQIDEMSKKTVIELTKETLHRLKGGYQVATVLDVGEVAFDTHGPDFRYFMCKPGRQVVTSRYPGCELDFDPLARDEDVVKYRMILDSEVRCCLALEDEEGVDV